MNAPAAFPLGTGSQVLDDLAEVIGTAAAFDLAWEFRGERLYIQKNPAHEPRLAAAIGAELAARLCEVFGGTTVPIPHKAVAEHRVRQLLASGKTRREIARECCIREARVYAILKKDRDSSATSSQLSMF